MIHSLPHSHFNSAVHVPTFASISQDPLNFVGEHGGRQPTPQVMQPCKLYVVRGRKQQKNRAAYLLKHSTAGRGERAFLHANSRDFAEHFVRSTVLLTLHFLSSKTQQEPWKNQARNKVNIHSKFCPTTRLNNQRKRLCGKLHFEYQIPLFCFQIFALVSSICQLAEGVEKSANTTHLVASSNLSNWVNSEPTRVSDFITSLS